MLVVVVPLVPVPCIVAIDLNDGGRTCGLGTAAEADACFCIMNVEEDCCVGRAPYTLPPARNESLDCVLCLSPGAPDEEADDGRGGDRSSSDKSHICPPFLLLAFGPNDELLLPPSTTPPSTPTWLVEPAGNPGSVAPLLGAGFPPELEPLEPAYPAPLPYPGTGGASPEEPVKPEEEDIATRGDADPPSAAA